ncbi:MAG TPA: O-antigen ligase family protein [Candidatus Methylacidiphilales bacterium]|jgi:O-antigen ligase|nr:O-antigen ligase family protein [Candidatus Methylacidiphilales bacterium]
MNHATSSSGRIGRWLASSINELALAWWTCTSFYLMFATGGHNEFVLFIPLAIGAPLFICLTWGKPVIAHVEPLMTTGVFLLFASILGSYLFNSEYQDLVGVAGNIVSAILLFFVLYLVVMQLNIDLQKLLIFQAIYIDILLPVVLHTSSDRWGRLEPAQLHPNYVSMMGIVAVIGAMSSRNILTFLLLAPLPFYTMLKMESRASMLATCAAAAIIIGCYLWEHRSRKMMHCLAAGIVFGGVVVVASILAGHNIFEFAGDKISDAFMLDDDLRGVDSGASGRSDLWAAAYNLWATHPIFGVGFKEHMNFMPDNMVAHNAFLGLLADNGLVGLVGYLLIIGVGVFYIFRRGPKRLTMFGQRAAIIFPYFLYGMVESRAFSFGNTYSVLFLLVAFDSAKYRASSDDAKPTSALEATRTPRSQRPQPAGTLSR